MGVGGPNPYEGMCVSAARNLPGYDEMSTELGETPYKQQQITNQYKEVSYEMDTTDHCADDGHGRCYL